MIKWKLFGTFTIIY
jgi:hypothetical protein